jgi:hypothetical protein
MQNTIAKHISKSITSIHPAWVLELERAEAADRMTHAEKTSSIKRKRILQDLGSLGLLIFTRLDGLKNESEYYGDVFSRSVPCNHNTFLTYLTSAMLQFLAKEALCN